MATATATVPEGQAVKPEPTATGLHRGRPRKSEADKLRPVTINLRPADFEAVCARARATREDVAVTLRNMALTTLHKDDACG